MSGNERHDVKQRVWTLSFPSSLASETLSPRYDEEVTNQKVQKFRKVLIEREGLYDKTEIEYDEQGRPM